MAALLVVFAWGDGSAHELHVPCVESGPACGEALQSTIDTAPPGTTLTLEAGKVYEGTITIKPKVGASEDKRLTITTRGWSDKGSGWDGLVTPADKPRMAVLRGSMGGIAGIEIQNGEGGGHVALFGVALEAIPPAGQGEVIRIGTGAESKADNMARDISIRQVLIQGSREFGQKRGISANGRDIDVSQVWCEEIFIAGQDTQCVAAWNGGQRVSVRYSYLSAGAENIMVGGAPIASPEMMPEDWLIEDVIVHKPLRWKEDGRNRQVKNLLEFKQGKNITVRRVLGVNNWRAAQDGMALLLNYTTNGACPQCGNLEKVLIEDVALLNVAGGISFQGHSWQRDSHSDGKLRDVTVRNTHVEMSQPGRLLLISNVLDRHNIRVERSTFVSRSPSWLMGSYGRVWRDDDTLTPGGPMKGLWLVDNVITSNGKYGITAPDGQHFGSGLDEFVDEDLQIAGNVIGDAPGNHLANYNKHTSGGKANVSGPRDEMQEKLSGRTCAEWRPGVGADCERLAPVFALLRLLPEP